MDEGSKQAMLSAVRSVLVAIGGVLVTKGYIDDGALQSVIGAVMVILSIIWGVWDKYQAEAKTKVREATAMNVGIAVADATPGKTPAIAAENVPAVLANVSPIAPSVADVIASVPVVKPNVKVIP